MDLDNEVGEIFLKYYTPACALINESMEVLEFMGDTRLFLGHRAGKATLDIFSMLPPDISPVLRDMIALVSKTGIPHEKTGLELNFAGMAIRFLLHVFPLNQDKKGHYLIVFREPALLSQHAPTSPAPGIMPFTPLRQHSGLGQDAELAKPTTGDVETVKGRNEKAVTNAKARTRLSALQAENLELKTYNNELLQLAYVSSHDLQEPLRKILTYSDLILERLKPAMPAEGIQYSEKIYNAARHMSLLINDLLDYTNVSRSGDRFERTDLNETVRKVLDKLGPIIQEKKAKIETGQLPVAEAIPKQMEQLFYNLVDNALKFSHPQRAPEVVIATKKLSGDQLEKYKQAGNNYLLYHISISDNGIGFNQQYANRIFTLFQRLHNKQDFPGTGIGLALCRKIIMNHRGDLYAVSKENAGTTMHIILPAKQAF